jgi:hypothetical protein
MFEFIGLLGGFWFFCFVLLILVSGIFSAELDNFIGAGLTLIALIFGAQLFFDVPIIETIIDKPIVIIFAAVVYVLIGICYAVIYRYSRWLKSRAKEITVKWHSFQSAYEKDHKGEYPTTDEFRNSSHFRTFKPSSNVELITTWIIVWPWAVSWDLCNRPIRYIYKNTRTGVGKMLDSVGSKVTEKIIEDTK